MPDATDIELLRQYADRNSETAFAALVSRHLNLVYSAALRKTGNPDAADEITQAVFIILAQKAGRIADKTILPGWLYQTTRLTAASFLKSESRRVRREQEAYMQTELRTATPDEAWEQLAPLLEDAIGHLGEKERAAVVLRFFGEQSFAEVATAFGVSENAAKKRVSHALEKLHRYFSRRGVSSTTAIIAGAISANSVRAAPAALAKSVTAVALAKGAAANGSTLTLIKGALKIMAWTKAKTAIVVGVAAILAVGTTPIVIHLCRHEYAKRTGRATEQFAKTFFAGFAARNWDEVGKFLPLSSASKTIERMKEKLGGLEVISIGQPFQSNNSPGIWFVPYEIKLAPKDVNVRVSNANSARRYVVCGFYDSRLHPLEEWEWTSEPETLANDNAYARMSPADVVKACFEAFSKADWAALQKVAPDSYVEHIKENFAAAEKSGVDPRKLVPTLDVGEAVWSPEQSSYFVKCRETGEVQNSQLRIRRDERHKRCYYAGGL